MIVTCPKCGKRYHLEFSKPNQTQWVIRCSMCGYTWKHDIAIMQKEKEQTSLDEKISNESSENSSFIRLVAGFLIFAIFSIIFFMGRSWIMDKIPEFIPVYKTLGFDIEHPTEGLEIAQISFDRNIQEPREWIVSWVVINKTSKVKTIPMMVVSVLKPYEGKAKKVVQNDLVREEELFMTGHNRVLPGEQISFETIVKASQITKVEIFFH